MAIVKELLNKIDKEKTWEKMKNYYFQSDRYTSDILQEFHIGIIGAIEEMMQMEYKPSDNWIIIMCGYYDMDLNGEMVHYTSSDLYNMDDIAKSFIPFEFIDDSTAKSLTEEELHDLVSNKPLIQVWGFEFSDWKEVLGYHVHEKSIQKYGLECCMAHILFEMTYCGFSYVETKEARNKPSEELTEHDIYDENDTEDIPSIDDSHDDRKWLLSYLSWKEEYQVLKEVFDDITKGE